MSIRFASALVLLLGVGIATDRADAARPCPPDINCTGAVDVDDLLAVITAWGQTGTPANVDGAGNVNVDDLLAVMTEWGPCLFDFGPVYPNSEAWQIGLESVLTLTLPQATYDRIDRDLGIIRKDFPALNLEGHTMAWAPNQIIVALVQGADHTDYQCTNVFYQATKEELMFSSLGVDYMLVTLAGNLNIDALAAVYGALPAVNFAEPNGLFGGQNFWVPSILISPVGTWRWNIDDGFMDCFDGCDCHRRYEIDINAAGAITTSGCVEQGLEWCEFGGKGCAN